MPCYSEIYELSRMIDMKFFYKLEKKFGRYAIRNLSAYMVGCFLLGYILWAFAPDFYALLTYDTASVFVRHEFWRIFTWIFTIPGPISVLSILFLFFDYYIGTTAENAVGTFMYNIYVFGACILTTVGMLVNSAIDYLRDPAFFELLSVGAAGVFNRDTLEVLSAYGPTYYLSTSIFLMFALIYKDAMVLFMFVIPIKAAWVAVANIVYMVYCFIRLYIPIIPSRGIIAAILINFGVFCYIQNNYSRFRRPTKLQRKQRQEFRQKMRDVEVEDKLAEGAPRHKCTVCGRTEKDDENLEFRFCSRCNGNFEYCNEHLFTHEHKK